VPVKGCTLPFLSHSGERERGGRERERERGEREKEII